MTYPNPHRKPWHAHPLRTCRKTLQGYCAWCGERITAGQRYRDGKGSGRVHDECARQLMTCDRCGRGTTTAQREGRCARCQGKPDVGAWWNGEPCLAVRGTVVVGPTEAPQGWSRPFTGQRRRVVRVSYADQVFYLDDEGGWTSPRVVMKPYDFEYPAREHVPGEGWWKVTEGRGSPQHAHASVPVADPATWRAD